MTRVSAHLILSLLVAIGGVTASVADVPTADTSVSVDDGTTVNALGGTSSYTITASNAGSQDVATGAVSVDFPSVLTCSWTCASRGVGVCTADGVGDIDDSVMISSGADVTYQATCSVDPVSSSRTITVNATIESEHADPAMGGNSTSDTNDLGFFAGDFETGDTTGWTATCDECPDDGLRRAKR